MNNNTIVYVPDRNGIDRCNCPKCNGRAGTARVCFNALKLAARKEENSAARKAALLLLSCFFLEGQAAACVKARGVQHGAALPGQAEGVKPTINPDYYQSSDDPFRAD